MKHKKTVEKYPGAMEELGEDIWNLDYDALTKLFDILSKKFEKDSIHDENFNHPQVAAHLKNISKALKDILDKDIQVLAKLCRWYNEKGIR